jgi:hypothetical protein
MTKCTPELDAAILAGKKAEWKHHDLPSDMFQNTVGDGDRVHFQAAISKLLDGLEPPEWFSVAEDCGYGMAITELKRIAGIEEEAH